MKSFIDVPRSAIEHAIDEWILNERNRAILKRRLIDGITFERIAEEFEMSVRQIKTIVYRDESKILKHIWG